MTVWSAPEGPSGRGENPATRALVVAAGIAAAGFIGVFYLYPLANILWRGRSWNTIVDVLSEPTTWKIIWFTSWQAALSTVATVAIGLPIAHAIARYRFPGRAVLRAFVTVPFVLPTVVVATAFLSLSNRLGLDSGPFAVPGSVWAIILAHAFFNIAVVVRSVGGYWAQLDDLPESAARTLGAGRVRTFVLVTAPRLGPALLSSSAIAFLFSFTSFGVILILGGLRRATLETEIWRYATQRIDFDTAATLGLIQLVIVLAMLVVNSVMQNRIALTERTRPPAEVERRPSTAGEWASLAGSISLAILVIGVPIFVLVEQSLSTGSGYSFDYYRALGSQD
ncbi:MAG: ABC transporter permease, partial [Acidimicrobiales bacterium]